MARRRKGVTMNTSSIPLAEFSREEGLISPDFEHLPLQLPRRCLMAFLGEKRIAAFAEKRGGKVLGTFLSLTKPFPLYEIPGERSLSFWCRRLPAPRRRCSLKTASLPTAQKKCWPSAAAAPFPTFRKTASSLSKRPSGTKAPPTTTCRHPVSLSWTKSPSFT